MTGSLTIPAQRHADQTPSPAPPALQLLSVARGPDRAVEVRVKSTVSLAGPRSPEWGQIDRERTGSARFGCRSSASAVAGLASDLVGLAGIFFSAEIFAVGLCPGLSESAWAEFIGLALASGAGVAVSLPG